MPDSSLKGTCVWIGSSAIHSSDGGTNATSISNMLWPRNDDIGRIHSGMDLTTFESSTTSPLAKDTIAALIREQIIAGELRPGELIVERNWALQLNVAQASI